MAVNGLLLVLCNLIFILGTVLVLGEKSIEESDSIIWCTVGLQEQQKCKAFSQAVERDRAIFGSDVMRLRCKQGFNKEECMTLLDEETAHITSLDAGDVFVGGRYHSLIPIMQEIYPEGQKVFHSVAVIKRNGNTSDVHSLRDLRGKKACFGSVGSQAGWVIPVHVLMKEGGMEIIDCNNHVKSTINYFGPSCAINSLIDKYNPIGDNSDKLCEICIGRIPGERCTRADPYAGFEGAFRCLVEKGDVAFLKHTTVDEMTSTTFDLSGVSKSDFELLCRDGSRRSVDDYRQCNWGSVPTHAIVTTSAKSLEVRRMYQKFLKRAVSLYGGPVRNDTMRERDRFNQPADSNGIDRDRGSWQSERNNTDPNDRNSLYDRNDRNNDRNWQSERGRENEWGRDRQGGRNYPNDVQEWNNRGRYDPYGNTSFNPDTALYESFKLFASAPQYGIHHNLLLQDVAINLEPLAEPFQTYKGYLGKAALDQILGVRSCPVNRMTLCVTSEPEVEKCVKMRTALRAQLLKPDMSCFKGHSQIHCMQAINSGLADVAVFDAGDVYTAGLNYDQIPFISEVYNLEKPEYYVVAVAREEDPDTELTYLKGKSTCHTGINTAAGWIVPLAYLISNGWIRSYGCNSIRAAAEYFTKSCVPGALSTEYNSGVPYDNMCDLCHGSSFRYCLRDASEDYYGYTGAFRCLVEGGGDVAFVKHTTVLENTGGKRREWWARNAYINDYQLLCPDGTRAPVEDYRNCNLGKVKANAMVTRGGNGFNETQINAFINLLVYAQQYYARKDADDFSFSMFSSVPPFSDLIFQDATRQLLPIPRSRRNYGSYLGKDFLRARRLVDCHAGAEQLRMSVLGSLLTTALVILISRGIV